MSFEEAFIFIMIHQAARQFPSWNAATGHEYQQT